MPPENAPPSAAVWPGHHILARQRNASGRCPQPPPIQNQHWNQVRPPSWCHIDVCLHPKMSDQDQSRDSMGPHPLDMVHRLTLNGWPDRQGHVPRAARFYWSFRDELSIDGDFLTKGERVVIPPSCRDNIMADLHGSHASINKAMDLARTCVYWPGMEADVTDYIKWCLTCIECSNLPVEMLKPHEVPPWTLGKNRCWLLSRPFGKKASNSGRLLQQVPVHVFQWHLTHHFKTITYLRKLFTAEGIPAIVMSDNGPPFNGEEFRKFARDYDFVHTTSSPHFHQSEWIHQGHGEENQECLQENGWIPQCSG